jgi:hypothetical protein
MVATVFGKRFVAGEVALKGSTRQAMVPFSQKGGRLLGGELERFCATAEEGGSIKASMVPRVCFSPKVGRLWLGLIEERLSRLGFRSRLDGFQDSFRVRDPAQRHLGTEKRGVVIGSQQSVADWLAHAVSQQNA